eukprot:3591920-Amphidinium_carterae.1
MFSRHARYFGSKLCEQPHSQREADVDANSNHKRCDVHDDRWYKVMFILSRVTRTTKGCHVRHYEKSCCFTCDDMT